MICKAQGISNFLADKRPFYFNGFKFAVHQLNELPPRRPKLCHITGVLWITGQVSAYLLGSKTMGLSVRSCKSHLRNALSCWSVPGLLR